LLLQIQHMKKLLIFKEESEMNLKKALVGGTLAFSLAVSGLAVASVKGFSNVGEATGGKKVNSVYKIAEGESFPPIFPPVKTNSIIKDNA